MIVSLWGKEGNGKSSAGLTWPKPLYHLDLDVGGFERAAWRLDPKLRIKQCVPKEDVTKLDCSKYDILSKPELLPIQMEKMLGAQKQGVSVRFPRKVVGYKEVWEEIVIDFVAVCQNPAVRTVMIDSATQLWTICHTGHLQDKQEIQMATGIKETDDKFREKLLPVEFPNEKIRSVIYTARSCGKHLVMTHYPGDVYANKVTEKGVESYKTGETTLDGFKDTKKLVDIILWTYVEKNKPYAKVDIKCGVPGMGMSAVGLELPTPDYAGLLELQKLLGGAA